jgi:2-polyprenyl-3-methyl-5-hydroxy-6-metoxy-1,4-benzoquinol methylase
MLRSYYNLVYRRFTMPWEDEPPGKELVELVESGRVQPCRAIDLGCGSGRHTIYLAQHGFQVTGVDFSSAAIEKAHVKAEAAGVKVDFVVDDLTDLRQVEGTFDFLVDYGSMEELVGRARDRYVNSLLKLTKEGSLFLFVHHQWASSWWVRLNPFAVRPGEVERRFGSHFHIEAIVGEAGSAAYLMKRR